MRICNGFVENVRAEQGKASAPPPFPHPHLGLMKPAARWMHTRQPVCDYTPMPTAPLGWARGGGGGGEGSKQAIEGIRQGCPKQSSVAPS